MPSPSKQFWQNLQNDVFYGCVIKKPLYPSYVKSFFALPFCFTILP